MDKKTFDRIVQISEKIKSLETINEQIKKSTLSFIGNNHHDSIFLSKRKKVIQDILSKHEVEIRKEINDRCNDLKKQIEKL